MDIYLLALEETVLEGPEGRIKRDQWHDIVFVPHLFKVKECLRRLNICSKLQTKTRGINRDQWYREESMGTTINNLWKLFKKRKPIVDCAIDQWTKPFIWNELAQSEFIDFFYEDFEGERREEIYHRKSDRQQKLPKLWIHDYMNDITGYCPFFYYRKNVTNEIKGETKAQISLEVAEERWGDSLKLVACQAYRQRVLFGPSNPPVIDDVIPVRYIILEIIGKARWEGFMQADFQKHYGMDPRTSFHHIKNLIKLHLITKQSILISSPINDNTKQPVPPKSTKMLHLSKFSNVYTNTLQKAAAKICSVLENAPDQIMERNALRKICSDIPQFKKVRQWLFQTGCIQYIIDGQIWTADNTSALQIAHFRASRPCYVNLLRKFTVSDWEDDKDDEFMDYIENCDAIEPQLVYEETLHHQGYRVVLACREQGITMKKLAEVLCIPYSMARSMIRYFDTNNIGRIITVDHLKLKLQKIVAIQYLHQSETVQKIKSNKMKIEQHTLMNDDIKPDISKIDFTSKKKSDIKEKNLELADDIALTRVSEKSKVSLRHLARKNYLLDALQEKPVWEGLNDLYKGLLVAEDSLKNTQGTCCRKTFKRLIEALIKEKRMQKILLPLDEQCQPPLMGTFYCANNITEESSEFLEVLETAKSKYWNVEKRREMKKAVEDSTKKSNLDFRYATRFRLDDISEQGSKIELKFEEGNVNELTDTDDEEFKKSESLSTSFGVNSKFATYGRFQKLHMLHIYLWTLVYGTPSDIEEVDPGGGMANVFIDLVQSKHLWLKRVNGLPNYSQGKGWFNVADILSLMPFELTCRVVGIKCWSETSIKYLQDNERKLMKMVDLPPRLKYKLLVSTANKMHLDNCVDLLVFLAQMGLVAVSPTIYPKMRSEIMLYLRKEAKIIDTRFSQKQYCHIKLPEGHDAFPENVYQFKSLVDVEKYWTDLQFVCLNTPLGVNRESRVNNKEAHTDNVGMKDKVGKTGVNSVSNKKGIGRNYRSFTVLRDFQQYYKGKDFNNLEPVIFGNGLGAGGMDSVCFAHLAKNWKYDKPPNKKRKKLNSVGTTISEQINHQATKSDSHDELYKGKKITVKSSAIQNRKGGKGLKRKLSSTKVVMTKKMKIERKDMFDRMIAKRLEIVREKLRMKEYKKKLRKGKKVLYAQNHDDVDRAALRRMKGVRVSFNDREDSYILLGDIVRTMMKLTDRGKPLHKAHPKIFWREVRNMLHKDVPESRDKTWNAVERRARYIKRYPHSLIVHQTCVAELEQNQDFLESLECTKENWKEKLEEVFQSVKETYGRNFNEGSEFNNFPENSTELQQNYIVEYVYQQARTPVKPPTNEREIRISVLKDLIHNTLTVQKLSTYVPSAAFKVFDAYPPDELNEAFAFYKENKLIAKCRFDQPRKRSLPISTLTYNLSNVYYRLFEPVMPLRIYQAARSLFITMKEGKRHTSVSKESEILKLSQEYFAGSLLIDFKEVQGGHTAYILSALVNNKVNLLLQLHDEMTINDGEHLRNMKKRNLNYQRLAFEQRLRRGENLARKIDNSQECDRNPMTIKSKRTEADGQQVRVRFENEKSRNLENEEFGKDTTKSSSEKIDEDKRISESKCDDKPGNQFQEVIPVDHSLEKSKRKARFQEKSTEAYSKQFEFNSFYLDKKYPTILASISDPGKQIYCSYKYFAHGKQCLKCPKSRFKRRMDIDFTSEETTSSNKTVKNEPKPKLYKGNVDIFKSGKLHASRTSLMMHRSIANEKLVPTNAMNTHDALVINPMIASAHLKVSPFQTFFTKLKPSFKSTSKETIKRFREQKREVGLYSDGLSTDEFKEILKDIYNYNEDMISEYMKLISLIKKGGAVGVQYRELKNRFKEQNWNLDDALQTLLNFRMVYRAGHYEDKLVTSTNLSFWTYRAVQIVTDDTKNPIESVTSALASTNARNQIPEKDNTKPQSVSQELCMESATSKESASLHSPAERLIKDIPSKRENAQTSQTPDKVLPSGDDNDSNSLSITGISETDKSNNKRNNENSIPEEIPDIESINLDANSDKGLTEKQVTSEIFGEDSLVNTGAHQKELILPAHKFTYKTVYVRPWLKLNGELNGVLLKRFQEIVLTYIQMNPGCLESTIVDHFFLVLRPVATKAILNFLVINQCISRHYQQKRKVSLFSSFEEESKEGTKGNQHDVYYLPVRQSLLNMMDINR